MMNWPYHSFILNGEKAKFPKNRLDIIFKKVQRIANRRFPIVLTLKHLSILTAVPFRDLRAAMIQKHKSFNYRCFKISKKKSLKKREISIPHPIIAKVQDWILKNILNRILPNPHSYAYEKDISIKDCAQQHIGCRWLLKFDIENFFPSISEKHV